VGDEEVLIMNYHEAVAVAKSNPGSVMTRDASGEGFIVRLANGVIIDPPAQAGVLSPGDEPPFCIVQLDDENALLKKKVGQLSQQISFLQNRLAKVSRVVWERIEREEREEHTARDEIAKRLGAKMASTSPSVSSNTIVVHASTDGQD